MVQNVNPTFVKTPNFAQGTISTGSGIGSTYVTVYSGGANGSKVNGLIAVAAGTTNAYDIRVGVNGIPFTTVSVPLNAGFVSGTPSVNLLNGTNAVGLPIDSDGNPYILLPSSAYSLQVQVGAFSSQWSTGITMQFSAIAGDF